MDHIDKSLGLSSRNIDKVPEPETYDGVREIPKFMKDVFEMFDRNHFLQPTSNIIRSFHNLGTNHIPEVSRGVHLN